MASFVQGHHIKNTRDRARQAYTSGPIPLLKKYQYYRKKNNITKKYSNLPFKKFPQKGEPLPL